jgi:hypothetical protein
VLNGINSIECNDISVGTEFKSGMYIVRIMLNDQKNIVTYNLAIFVYDFKKEDTQARAENETSTN